MLVRKRQRVITIYINTFLFTQLLVGCWLGLLVFGASEVVLFGVIKKSSFFGHGKDKWLTK